MFGRESSVFWFSNNERMKEAERAIKSEIERERLSPRARAAATNERASERVTPRRPPRAKQTRRPTKKKAATQTNQIKVVEKKKETDLYSS